MIILAHFIYVSFSHNVNLIITIIRISSISLSIFHLKTRVINFYPIQKKNKSKHKQRFILTRSKKKKKLNMFDENRKSRSDE